MMGCQIQLIGGPKDGGYIPKNSRYVCFPGKLPDAWKVEPDVLFDTKTRIKIHSYELRVTPDGLKYVYTGTPK